MIPFINIVASMTIDLKHYKHLLTIYFYHCLFQAFANVNLNLKTL